MELQTNELSSSGSGCGSATERWAQRPVCPVSLLTLTHTRQANSTLTLISHSALRHASD